ncbi:MAG: hypothetical protein ABIS50_15500 [Luteolibacter sp.]|uniref:hypothetical protein n=1 Tax=Luteolibacter sp. TaxID=1962973 RepID=UPI00326645C7
MKKISAWAVLLFSGIGALTLFGQPGVDLALEEFASNDQGVSGPKTTRASRKEDVSYFLLENGANTEIFVSRPDLISDGIWILYQMSADGGGSIQKVGIAELNSSTLRLADRDGVHGYYEYHHGGAGKGTLTFNSFDGKRQLVASWEGEISPGGADKALYDSIYAGESNKPQISSRSVSSILLNLSNREALKSPERPGKRSDQDSPAPSGMDARSEKDKTGHSHNAGGSSDLARAGPWIVALFLAAIVVIIWQRRESGNKDR